ncbi:NADH-quinone oxidoreductase subunit NuoF [Geoalkalibacter subterraneus]|jgi:NADH-quinone oxidoreductase subunit F|uniref:NADH dehydrogenase n=1 Tax=Geoalkalibacter subterraneus TaxID=483547 RepID=A0A0B5FP68_9BACT|nr:NADH-quinone oxidoreductase subunit NuoF [Geoalkalibacter subterraneus]AJF05396.1 NADH dehydrogenase [Geoalkalibacter subterraneus]
MAEKAEELRVLICQGTGGLASGAQAVEDAFRAEFEKHGVEGKVGKRCTVVGTGCRGLCANDVLVDICIPGQEAVTYDFVKPELVTQIVEEHILKGEVVAKKKAGPYYNKFLEKQMRVVFSRCGTIDAESLDDFLAHEGFTGIKKAVKMKPQEVIDEVKKSGLRGRGGGGFPTGVKWGFCAASPGDDKYLICNADEGDPGAFMDRSILEGDPYGLIEGMMIAAYAIGCKNGYVYVRAEYPLAIQRLQKAIDVCYEKGFLGKDCMGLGFDFDLKIKAGAGAFVCGEETALMASIEGERGMPRPRPPFPAVRGLWTKPTNINNVETFANVSFIFYKGADWYSSIGTEGTKGTKIFALTGKIKHTGLVEVPAGITMREVIYDVCGGILNNRKFKAVQAGGPSGGCLPGEAIDAQVDYDSLIKAGAMMGSGGLVVMDETTCMVDIARFFLNFTRAESCGKCVPCRIGLKNMLDILERITEGHGREGDIELLEDMCVDIKKASLCGLGQTAPNPVLSTIRYFRDEYEAHIKDQRCPSNSCKALLKFEVIEEACKKCGLCYKICPVDAIKWEKGEVAIIDKEKCTECTSCYDACRFMAIE